MRNHPTLPPMDEQEWRNGLKRLNMTASDAARLIYYQTGIVIEINDTYRQFGRGTYLSRKESAMWRLFFKIAKRRPHHAAA